MVAVTSKIQVLTLGFGMVRLSLIDPTAKFVLGRIPWAELVSSLTLLGCRARSSSSRRSRSARSSGLFGSNCIMLDATMESPGPDTHFELRYDAVHACPLSFRTHQRPDVCCWSTRCWYSSLKCSQRRPLLQRLLVLGLICIGRINTYFGLQYGGVGAHLAPSWTHRMIESPGIGRQS